MKRPLVLLLGLALAGCATPPPAPPPEDAKPETWTADRPVVRALRDFLYATYAIRLAKVRPEAAGDLAGLQDQLALASDGLRNSLVAAGAERDRLKDNAALLESVHGGIRRGGRYELLFTPGDEGSFALARIREERAPRKIVLFEQTHPYQLTVFDETLIVDYPTYVAAKLGVPASKQTATYARNGVVRVDLATAAAVGEHLFLPHTETLRASARLAEDDASFTALADQPLEDLLTLTKNALRWRSLEQLWSMIRSRPQPQQLERFAADYAERAELRAVAEQREAVLLQPDPEKELSEDERVLLFELGSLSAVIHGEPLGQVADVLALAAHALKVGGNQPQFRAAKQLVFELAARLRIGEGSPEADALAFARLARSNPDQLRKLARIVYKVRTS